MTDDGGLTEEELRALYQTNKLAFWMNANSDNIFVAVPEKYIFAVGVVEKIGGREIPTIYYFEHRDEEAFPIWEKALEKGKGSFILWRYAYKMCEAMY